MRITDLLKDCSIELNTSAATKQEAIEKLVGLMEKAGNVPDHDQYLKDVLALATAKVMMLSSVIWQPSVMNSKDLLLLLFHSNRDPTISPIIAPSIRPHMRASGKRPWGLSTPARSSTVWAN